MASLFHTKGSERALIALQVVKSSVVMFVLTLVSVDGASNIYSGYLTQALDERSF